uniref:SMC hinge domain-containing protein n=1 Tax=Xiphophorus couchianus TaxID=32473 RepID=A0A3B5KX13_9TELE
MGYLKQIDIENFKSWRGKQVIGPFMRFNCIIGTNGSGKSNVMDALSFAIGERVASLRVKHLRDLVHGAHVGKPVSDTARVALRFLNDDEIETVFSRTITGDSSAYHINGSHVSHAKYIEELEKIGIVTKAQNCVVFQMLECICQSKQYAAEYKTKKEALMKAKEDTQFHFNKKKSATVERKQVSLEKVEAQKYQELVDDLNEKRLQLSLFELYHNEKGIDAISDTLRGRKEIAAEMNRELGAAEQNVKTHKKEHGRRTREVQHMGKEIRCQVLIQSRSQYIKAKVNTSHHVKKAEEICEAVKKKRRALAAKEQQLEEGRQEVAELQRAWRRYEKQTQEGVARGRDISLDEDQVTMHEPYKELKVLAQKQGAVLCQQADKLHWEVRADSEKVVFDQRRKKEIEVAIRNNQTHLEEFMSRAEKLEEYTQKCKKSLEDLDERQQSLTAELQHVTQRGEEVKQELDQVMEELRSARLDSHESKRQQQRRELLEKLHRLYPQTVFGRLSDLCSPVHKKYQLAVTKVFGRYMNAIVVSSEKVARDCISFLKEQRAEPETFLPVDYLLVNPLNERLREIPGVKMVVDVVQVNAGSAQLWKVVQYVCGNALVCETMREARSVAFDRPDRVRTVTLDGTLFKTSGVISGGSSDLRTKARCWEEKDVRRLKEHRDRLMNEMRDLSRLKRKEANLNQILAESQGAQTRLKYTRMDLEVLRSKTIPKCQAEISRLESELSNLEELTKLQREVMSAETALEQKRMARHNMLLACKIQDLRITMLSGSLNEISELNYFSTQVQFNVQCEQLEAHMEKLKESVSSLEEVLHRTTPPNLKALEKMREVKDKLQGVTEARRCNQEFEQVKAQRFHLFSQCFEHVLLVIDQIYKRICRNGSAQAILSAENPEEPYLGGINYNCVAPGKRFMSMDNLSGGEKAIAALCNCYYYCYFSVDAALDNTNIGKVTSFIREESRENMQIIVISLKEEFFSKADALLGVYSDLDGFMFSRVLTLDLRPYPLAEEESDNETDKESRADRGSESCCPEIPS